MINTELKDLIRKAYKAGRRNALKQDESNLNDFINKHESRLKLFAIPNVVGQSEQFYCSSFEDGEWRCETQCLGCAGLEEEAK